MGNKTGGNVPFRNPQEGGDQVVLVRSDRARWRRRKRVGSEAPELLRLVGARIIGIGSTPSLDVERGMGLTLRHAAF